MPFPLPFYLQNALHFELDDFGATERQKNDVTTEIFNQGIQKTLARGREKP